MNERERKLKSILENDPNGAKVAANLDDILAKVNTPENVRSMNKFKSNQLADKAMQGDAQAMSALIKEMMACAEGKQIIEQVQQAAGK